MIRKWSTTREIWKAVPGYEGFYEVSAFGQVRSIDRVSSSNRCLKGKLLNQYDGAYGKYWYVTLSRKGITKNFFVHQLVLLAFRGPCPIGELCCHENGDGRFNHVNNLRWDTPTSNMEDTFKHGSRKKFIFSRRQIRKIVRLDRKGYRRRDIALNMNVSRPTILKALRIGRAK